MASTGCAGSAIDQINATIITPPKRVKICMSLCKLAKAMSIKWDLYSAEPTDAASLWSDISPWKEIRASAAKGRRGRWLGNGKHTKKHLWRTDVSTPSFVLWHVPKERLLWNYNSPWSFCTFRCSIFSDGEVQSPRNLHCGGCYQLSRTPLQDLFYSFL